MAPAYHARLIGRLSRAFDTEKALTLTLDFERDGLHCEIQTVRHLVIRDRAEHRPALVEEATSYAEFDGRTTVLRFIHPRGVRSNFAEYCVQLLENRGSRGGHALPRITIVNPSIDEAVSSYKGLPVFKTALTKYTGCNGDVAKEPHLD